MYHTAKGGSENPNEIEDIHLQFEFKDEWEILREHEKWRANLSSQENKRKATLGGGEESSVSIIERPTGVKKAKAMASMSDRTDLLFPNCRKKGKVQEAMCTR